MNSTTEVRVHLVSNTLAYVHFLIGTYIIIANSLVIIAVAKYDYLKTRANIYLVSLAMTDACVGVMEWIVGSHNHQFGVVWFDQHGLACVGMFSFAFFTLWCSMSNMVLIALDRLFYIVKPFEYHRLVTSLRVKVTIGFVWFFCVISGITPLFIHTYDKDRGICTIQTSIPPIYRCYIHVPFLFSGAITCGTCYIIIARKAMQHKKAILSSVHVMGFNERDKKKSEAYLSENARKTLYALRSNMKTLKLFVIVFGLLIICWFPYYIFEFFGEFTYIPDKLYRASTALGFLNSGMNFLIYPMYSKKFRRAFKAIMCPCLKINPSMDSDTDIYTNTSTKPCDISRQPATYVTEDCDADNTAKSNLVSFASSDKEPSLTEKANVIEESGGAEHINDAIGTQDVNDIHIIDTSESSEQIIDAASSNETIAKIDAKDDPVKKQIPLKKPVKKRKN